MTPEEHVAHGACVRLAQAGHLHTIAMDPRLYAKLPAIQRAEVEALNAQRLAEIEGDRQRNRALKVARIRHELLSVERQPAVHNTGEARERDDRVAQLRRDLAAAQ